MRRHDHLVGINWWRLFTLEDSNGGRREQFIVKEAREGHVRSIVLYSGERLFAIIVHTS